MHQSHNGYARLFRISPEESQKRILTEKIKFLEWKLKFLSDFYSHAKTIKVPQHIMDRNKWSDEPRQCEYLLAQYLSTRRRVAPAGYTQLWQRLVGDVERFAKAILEVVLTDSGSRPYDSFVNDCCSLEAMFVNQKFGREIRTLEKFESLEKVPDKLITPVWKELQNTKIKLENLVSVMEGARLTRY